MKTRYYFFLTMICLFPLTILAQNVGIGTVTPPQLLTIQGKLQLGNDNANPTKGAIRYNDITDDFEGWTGFEWKSFTFNHEDVSTGYYDENANTFSYIGQDTDMSWDLAVGGSLATDKVQVFAENNGCWGWQYSISNTFPSNDVSDQFGSAVDLGGAYGGETLLIGSPSNDHYGVDAGIAGVYRVDKTTSDFKYTIAPPDIAAGDAFGRSLTSNGRFLAIGAPYHDNLYTNSGSVYIYQDNVTGAALKQKISSPQAEVNGNFGYKVVLSGSDLFIYARGEGGWTLNGKVYYYIFQPLSGTYAYHQTIGNPEPGSYRYFGAEMAAEGNHLMIGTAQSNSSTYDGTVLYYEKNTTTGNFGYTQKLTVPYTSDNDNFGSGIAVDDERMVASAPGNDTKGKNAGALFLFEKDGNTWNQTKMLTVSDSSPNMYLGRSLSTYSFWYNTVFIGSPSYNSSTGTLHFLKVK